MAEKYEDPDCRRYVLHGVINFDPETRSYPKHYDDILVEVFDLFGDDEKESFTVKTIKTIASRNFVSGNKKDIVGLASKVSDSFAVFLNSQKFPDEVTTIPAPIISGGRGDLAVPVSIEELTQFYDSFERLSER